MAGLPPAATGGSGSGSGPDATGEVGGGLPFAPPADPLVESSVVGGATGSDVPDGVVTLAGGALAVPGLLGTGPTEGVGVPTVVGPLLSTGAVTVAAPELGAPAVVSRPGLSVRG
jgi:hypothetical protein